MNIRKRSMDELDRMDPEGFKSAEKTPVIVVLENVRSAFNIGSIFRTADAFRIEAIYLTGFSALPPHKEILKTALGATESVHWEYFEKMEHAIEKLKLSEYIIACVEQASNSRSLESFIPSGKTAYVFGNEVHGVDLYTIAKSDMVLEIPQFGTKHSFNIAITAGIILWHHFLRSSGT
jgi:23S rRNA (guanosine2251-2'-O)-methyltransferase